MGAVVVVMSGEFVEEALELVEAVGIGLGGEVFLEGLLETFDFSAGGGVVRRRVLLFGAEVSEAGFAYPTLLSGVMVDGARAAQADERHQPDHLRQLQEVSSSGGAGAIIGLHRRSRGTEPRSRALATAPLP